MGRGRTLPPSLGQGHCGETSSSVLSTTLKSDFAVVTPAMKLLVLAFNLTSWVVQLLCVLPLVHQTQLGLDLDKCC